ncbi:hypothetical protein ACFWMU_25525 [Streptomyces sp. NPDC058357]|uniref:hypothetical protein n=1 Tax=unclassified Streptomyces TaxID=2593676 RepID=UPI00365345D3
MLWQATSPTSDAAKNARAESGLLAGEFSPCPARRVLQRGERGHHLKLPADPANTTACAPKY